MHVLITSVVVLSKAQFSVSSSLRSQNHQYGEVSPINIQNTEFCRVFTFQ